MVKMDMRVEELLKMSVMNAVEEVITKCASMYNFNASEAKSALYPEDVVVVRESSWCASCASCAPSKPSKPSKHVEKKVAKAVAMPFPLPFSGALKEECCHALRQNSGLYTQCANEKCESERYCGQCSKQAEKSETGAPEYGTIESRMLVGLHDYVDSKGRKPVHYTKIMKKLNLTESQVMELANKHGVRVDGSHFIAPVDASKRGRPKSEKAVNSAKSRSGVKGRPKKEKKVVQIAGDEDDLFANLVAQANQVSPADSDADEEEAIEVVAPEVAAVEVAALEVVTTEVAAAVEVAAAEVAAEVAVEVVTTKVPAVVEVAAAKVVKAASDKAAEKAEKEAQKAAEKAAKEAQKVAEKAAKEAEKAEKESEKAAEKAAKEAAKEAEKAAKVAEKEAQKAAKGAEKTAKVAEKVAEKAAKADDEAEVVKKIEFAGNKYLKSKKTGIVYDYAEYMKTGDQIVVGQWNNDTSAIDFKKACDDEEESEEEYEA
jgi:hypothetical protein